MTTDFQSIDTLAIATQLSAGDKKRAVYLLLQDRHVSQQREEYESCYKVFTRFEKEDHMIFPSEFDWLNDEWFYYIILKQRFHPELLSENEQIHIEGLQPWLEQHVPICTICGLRSLGSMCESEKRFKGVFLQWEFTEESVEDKGRTGKTLDSFIGSLFTGIPAVLQGIDDFSEENREHQAAIICSKMEQGRYQEVD